ncbi:MAG: YqgE/AlgH family protein [Spirochaetaceae bacterium]|nr:YqgE/AlgH family protein [Spirochaetaceae bacterium]MCF7949539.1 YqgE/AlgH family protein [Spirochaetia bacterium]MCF7952019.1 YqgE/AlgH family protein [Spirochaetaceae bacterium]
MKDFEPLQVPPPLEPEELPEYLLGYMLISESDLRDPNFFQTIVLILTHDQNGAMGLVINRPSDTTLSEIAEDMTSSEFADAPIHIGGPVDQNYLFALHSGFIDNVKSDGAIQVADHIVFEPDFTLLHSNYRQLKQEEGTIPPTVKFFAGYAGWAGGQIEDELRRNDWIVIPAAADLVFSQDPGETWKKALYKKGGVYWVAAETGHKPSIN